MTTEISNRIAESDIARAMEELTPHNVRIFDNTVEKHIQNPSSKQFHDIVLNNAETLQWTIYQLSKYEPELSEEEFDALNGYKKATDKYFDKYGYQTKIADVLRRTYFTLVKLIQRLSPYSEYKYPLKYPESYYEEYPEEYYQKKIQSNPNIPYQYYYRKYKKMFNDKMNRGLGALTEEELGLADKTSPLGLIQRLAWDDVKRWSTTEEDYNEHRGDLRVVLGTMTHGQLVDEKFQQGAELLEQRETEKRIKEIKAIEGMKEETLSEDIPQWLRTRLDEKMRKDGLIE